MKNVALILTFVFAGGCNLYMDLAPIGEDTPDMSLDVVVEPDIELDLTDQDMTNQPPSMPDMADMHDMAETDVDADADADADADMAPLAIESLLSEAQIAYDFKTIEMNAFPSLIPDGPALLPQGDTAFTNNSVLFSGGALTTLPPTEFYTEAIVSQAFTVSLWLRTASLEQINPSEPNNANYNGRIFTLSEDAAYRNFTLAQWRDQLLVRIRDVDASDNGLPMDMIESFFVLDVQHVAVTVSNGQLVVYLDGQQVFTRSVNTFNWDLTYPLGVGNEFESNRPWEGELFDLRAWGRGLSDNEVALLHDSGIP